MHLNLEPAVSFPISVAIPVRHDLDGIVPRHSTSSGPPFRAFVKASAPHDRALGVKHPDDVNQPVRRQPTPPAPVNPSGASQSLRVSRRAPRSRAGPHLRLPSTPSSMSGWTRRPCAPSSCPKLHTMPKSRSLTPRLARARLISVVWPNRPAWMPVRKLQCGATVDISWCSYWLERKYIRVVGVRAHRDVQSVRFA